MLSESLSEINSFLEVQESRVIKMVMFISECRSDGGGPEAALVRDTDNGEIGVLYNERRLYKYLSGKFSGKIPSP